jgi:hypothetical protein
MIKDDSYGQDTCKLFPRALLDAHKSSRFRCIAGLTSHCIRLMGVVETGLLAGPSEKKVAKPAAVLNRRFLRWGFENKGLQNCGHFSRFSTRSRRTSLQPRLSGGESGIRTHVRVSPKHAFQACAFSHSAISPAPRAAVALILTAPRDACGLRIPLRLYCRWGTTNQDHPVLPAVLIISPRLCAVAGRGNFRRSFP